MKKKPYLIIDTLKVRGLSCRASDHYSCHGTSRLMQNYYGINSVCSGHDKEDIPYLYQVSKLISLTAGSINACY